MCLAVPGLVHEVMGEADLRRTAKVSFDGAAREISLGFLPDVKPGDYVLVHAGMALSKVDPVEAKKLIEDIRDMEAAMKDDA